MGVGSGLYMFDVVVKRSRSLSHLLMSSCLCTRRVYVYIFHLHKLRHWTNVHHILHILKALKRQGLRLELLHCVFHAIILNKNSSGDEIANVNFLQRYGTYVLQNTKKREPTSFNQLDDS